MRLLSFCALLVLLATSVVAESATPIVFSEGETTKTLRGYVHHSSWQSYALEASADDQFECELKSKENNAHLQVEGPKGLIGTNSRDHKWTGKLTETGPYTITILCDRGRGLADYQLTVTKSHLKTEATMNRPFLKRAVDNRQWDLLDKLLEQNKEFINDNRMYTDTWGEWWGMMGECARKGHMNGIRVLLKHGADKNLKSWGDCLPMSAVEIAREKGDEKMLKLLESPEPPTYVRKTDPPLPEPTEADKAVIRQHEIAKKTGLVFQLEAIEEKE